jgi:hypothetical protein
MRSVIVYIKRKCCRRIVYQFKNWSPLLQPLRRCGQYITPKAGCSKQHGHHIFIITCLATVLFCDSYYVFTDIIAFYNGMNNPKKMKAKYVCSSLETEPYARTAQANSSLMHSMYFVHSCPLCNSSFKI